MLCSKLPKFKWIIRSNKIIQTSEVALCIWNIRTPIITIINCCCVFLIYDTTHLRCMPLTTHVSSLTLSYLSSCRFPIVPTKLFSSQGRISIIRVFCWWLLIRKTIIHATNTLNLFLIYTPCSMVSQGCKHVYPSFLKLVLFN